MPQHPICSQRSPGAAAGAGHHPCCLPCMSCHPSCKCQIRPACLPPASQLVRDFIHDSLYHPREGYFSKQTASGALLLPVPQAGYEAGSAVRFRAPLQSAPSFAKPYACTKFLKCTGCLHRSSSGGHAAHPAMLC